MESIRIGHGYDVHALAPGLPMRICGVNISHGKGFVAHSDGDVAVHALCDALLGAAAMGDIGLHFPDSDEEYRGVDSMVLLGRCIGLLESAGYAVINVDITIALQHPKLRPYIERMRENIAKALGVTISSVSVKATTTERLGFVGREEGAEAYAVALIGGR